MGTHERLKSGNILINEAQKGAVIEVDPWGRLAWEFNNVYDDQQNGLVANAAILPEGFLSTASLECSSR